LLRRRIGSAPSPARHEACKKRASLAPRLPLPAGEGSGPSARSFLPSPGQGEDSDASLRSFLSSPGQGEDASVASKVRVRIQRRIFLRRDYDLSFSELARASHRARMGLRPCSRISTRARNERATTLTKPCASGTSLTGRGFGERERFQRQGEVSETGRGFGDRERIRRAGAGSGNHRQREGTESGSVRGNLGGGAGAISAAWRRWRAWPRACDDRPPQPIASASPSRRAHRRRGA
jgi:hypothetical protein